MISSAAFVFVLLPCIAASLVAMILIDWRLAAAVACGALGLLFLAPALPEAVRVFGGPVMTGVALGALAVVALLVWRPVASMWSRMMVALMVTFALTFGNLITLGVS